MAELAHTPGLRDAAQQAERFFPDWTCEIAFGSDPSDPHTLHRAHLFFNSCLKGSGEDTVASQEEIVANLIRDPFGVTRPYPLHVLRDWLASRFSAVVCLEIREDAAHFIGVAGGDFFAHDLEAYPLNRDAMVPFFDAMDALGDVASLRASIPATEKTGPRSRI